MKRYFLSGDGKIELNSERNPHIFSGVYRKNTGEYDQAAVMEICSVFGAPAPASPTGLSLRLVEFIDFLQDQFNPNAQITITSGYRNPEYNTMLRKKGNLAAKASLHQYGMAADLKIEGVDAKKLWEYVKSLKFGGAGYYNGESVHIDVGPFRYWTQTTSGVGTGISDDNKLIGLTTDFDIYHSGNTIFLRFIRMTAFPVKLNPEFILIHKAGQGQDGKIHTFTPAFSITQNNDCPEFGNFEQMDRIQWKLPSDISSGRYVIQARKCGNLWKDMPESIETPEFEVIGSIGRNNLRRDSLGALESMAE